MIDEAALLEKLRKVEAAQLSATTDGAGDGASRMRERLREAEEMSAPDLEFRFTLHEPWAQHLFVAVCRRYAIEPYRNRGQRRTTLMVRAPRWFVDRTLWPAFSALERELRSYVSEVTERVIRTVVHADASDAAEREAPAQLTGER